MKTILSKTSFLLKFLARPRNLWGVIFLYTMVGGLLVQLIFLPYLAPSWHAGHGLIKDMDGLSIHKTAFTLSEKIKAEGWGGWEAKPDGMFVSGMAAIFYTLIYPEPWSILPLNGTLNAFAGVAFFRLLSFFIPDKRKNLLATLPFIFFPSALLWNTQLYNETFIVPAVIFILLGWVMIATIALSGAQTRFAYLGMAVFLIAFGSMFILLTRYETLLLLTGDCILVTIALHLYWFVQVRGGVITTQVFLAHAFVAWLACIIMLLGLGAINKLTMFNSPEITANHGNQPLSRAPSSLLSWQRTSWLPEAVDHQLKVLSGKREKFLSFSYNSGSAIDLDVTFNSAAEIFAYLPRAFQIGMFSPFPAEWFEKGKKPVGTAMRLESALEMLFSYFCLIGLPLFAWKNRTKPAFLAVLVLCFSAIIVYSITTPNQGALFRFRYPQYMPLVGLGLAGWLTRKTTPNSNSQK